VVLLEIQDSKVLWAYQARQVRLDKLVIPDIPGKLVAQDFQDLLDQLDSLDQLDHQVFSPYFEPFSQLALISSVWTCTELPLVL
jgi:hypothetical protein